MRKKYPPTPKVFCFWIRLFRYKYRNARNKNGLSVRGLKCVVTYDMCTVLMKVGSRCKTIFSLFQAGCVHPYGNRASSDYAETAMIRVGVKSIC